MSKNSLSLKTIVLLLLSIVILGLWRVYPHLGIFIKQNGPGIKSASIPPNFYVWEAKWSPDGKKIAFIADIRREPFSKTSVYLYDTQEEKIEEIPLLAENISKTREFLTEMINWSPDGNKLFFSGSPTGEVNYQGIWSVDLKNYSMEMIFSGNVLAWSPNGSNIAIIDVEVDRSTVRVINLQNREEKIIYEFKHVGGRAYLPKIEWSPYGNIFAIEMPEVTDDGFMKKNIYFLSSDGSNYHQFVIDSDKHLVSPVWYPNSLWFAYIEQDGGQGTIKFAPLTGECMYDWLPQIKRVDTIDIAEDGKTALVVSWGDLYIVDLEKAARPPISDGQPKCP